MHGIAMLVTCALCLSGANYYWKNFNMHAPLAWQLGTGGHKAAGGKRCVEREEAEEVGGHQARAGHQAPWSSGAPERRVGVSCCKS
jgi:hypothetical protein